MRYNMAIIEKFKNTYDKVKSSIKESIFSKNKSIIRFSEFNKKSFLKKISITTFINMLFTLPFVILFSTPDFSGFQHASQFLFSFFSVFFISNLFGYSLLNLISFGFEKFKNKFFPKFQPAFTVKDDEIKPEYFPSGIMNRIREFFISTFSIATSFIPFLFLATLVLAITGIGDDNFSTFNFLSILELDAIMLVTLTTITSLTTYSFKSLFYLKNKLNSFINRKKENLEENKKEEPYVPKRSFPAEEFAVSLHQDFKKSNDINAYEELKVMTKDLPQKSKE